MFYRFEILEIYGVLEEVATLRFILRTLVTKKQKKSVVSAIRNLSLKLTLHTTAFPAHTKVILVKNETNSVL